MARSQVNKSVFLKRAYEGNTPRDGYRILVDRLWPRGMTKEGLQIDEWIKEIAPSNELRKWFGHDPTKWSEFRVRYFEELEHQPEIIAKLKNMARKRRLTLVYAAKDETFNNAIALREYLESKLRIHE